MESTEENIISRIKEGSTFEEQIAILQRKFQTDASTIEDTYKEIHDDLMSALSHIFPQTKICFGSVVTGLMIKGSNVDIHIANILTNLNLEKLILESVKTLLEQSKNFFDLHIAEGEFAYIKCKHKTGNVCKVDLHSNLSVVNSELLSYFINQNEKVRTLIIMLKFWLKFYKFTEIDNFDHVAYLMVIFYLQQEPYKLPPASKLLNNSGDSDDCLFVSYSFTSEALKKVTILELVKGFFGFYNTFDYISNVIAPYCGTTVEKINLLKPFNLPECYKLYEERNIEINITGGICIQDPTDLSKNVTAGLPLHDSADLIYLFGKAFRILQNPKEALLDSIFFLPEDMKDYRQFTLMKQSDLDGKEWFELVTESSKKVLINIFGCAVRKPRNNSGNIQLNCFGAYTIFEKRVNILKPLLPLLPPNASDIDKEMIVASFIRKQYHDEKPPQKQKPTWKFSVELLFNETPTSVVFNFTGSNSIVGKKHVDLFFKKQLMELLRVKEKSPKVVEKNGAGRLAEDSNSRSSTDSSCTSNIAKFKKVRDNLMKTMEKVSDFDEQLSIIERKFYVPKKEAEAESKLVLNDVKSLLSKIFPDNEMTAYGSVSNDLFTQNSDISIFVAKVKPHLVLKELLTTSFSCSEKFTLTSKVESRVCFSHHETGRIGMLNLKDATVLKATELIKYYVSLDKKIRKMIIVIKLWAATYKLTQPRNFDSYIITLMVIFYLQQKYSLPSVMELQKEVVPVMINGWNFAFSPAEVESSLFKDVTVRDLLTGFFEFYGNFDFFTYVISIYFPSPLKKLCFLHPFDVPTGYELYACQKYELDIHFGLCVQDPFVHTRTVSKNVPDQDVGLFATLCRPAAFWMTCKAGSTGPLFSLMSRCTGQNFEEFTVYKGEKQNEQEWKERVKDFALKVLPGLLGCDIKKVHSENEAKVHFVSQGYCHGWTDRMKFWKKLDETNAQRPFGLDDIDVELAISSSIRKERSKGRNVNLIDVCANFKDNPTHVVFMVRGRGRYISEHGGVSMFFIQHFIYTRLCVYLDGTVKKPEEGVTVQDDVARSVEVCQLKRQVSDEIICIKDDVQTEGPLENVCQLERQVSDDIICIKDDVQTEGALQNVCQLERQVSDDIICIKDDAKTEGALQNDTTPSAEINEDGSCGTKADVSEDDENVTFAEPVDVDLSEIYMDLSDIDSNNPEQVQLDEVSSLTSEKPVEEKEIDVDDVPSDFFDDFTKEDFLDGLDILDAPDKNSKRKDVTSKKAKTKRRCPRKKRSTSRSKRSTSRSKRSTSGSKRSSSRSKRSTSRSKRSTSRSKRSTSRSRRSTSRSKRRKRSRSRSPVGERGRRRQRSRSRSRSRSPYVPRKRRYRRYNSRSRSRSPSPRRYRRSPEIKKRKSFLEEIRDKLNEVGNKTPPASASVNVPPPSTSVVPASMYVHPVPPPLMTLQVPPPVMLVPPPVMPIPAPVPPPGINSPVVYDQSFFIGTHCVTGTTNSSSVEKSKGRETIIHKSNATSTQPEDTISKLFTEKKITLTDYLTITAKHEVVSSDLGQHSEKLPVIAVCEELMKIMDQKTGGRLVISPSFERSNSSDVKYQSPVIKSQVKLKFTSYIKDVTNDPFSGILHNILQRVGVLDGERDVDKLMDSVAEAFTSGADIDKDVAAKILKISLLGSTKASVKRQIKEKKDVEMQCKTYASVAVQMDSTELSEVQSSKSGNSLKEGRARTWD